ncbi:ABC transporter permease, partial [Patescibacteria group bacterium]|nr:ABC transporter permease [Patescibacteria group bacterium]
MLTQDLIKETYTAIVSNKVRSMLTVLGIVIGIGSVIAMVSIGAGAQSSIESSIQSIGSNLLMVYPGSETSRGISKGAGTAKSLTVDDAQAIVSEIDNVSGVASEVSSQYQITANGENTNASVIGTDPAYAEVRNLEIDNGNFLTADHVDAARKVAVLGPNIVDELYEEGADPIGSTIRINGNTFTVIGVSEESGGGMGGTDDTIFIPISVAQRYFTGDDYVNQISIQATDAESTDVVQQEVTNLLLDRHGITDPDAADFIVSNMADILDAASSVTGTLTVFLGAIAGISLIVGGIGIMNMMLTSVTERTREIGLRKAIGAKANDISAQFLAESVMITFVGGALGVGFGWGAAELVSRFMDTTTVVTGSAILLAFGVSAAIGILFGYYPAKRASQLDPIEALR